MEHVHGGCVDQCRHGLSCSLPLLALHFHWIQHGRKRGPLDPNADDPPLRRYIIPIINEIYYYSMLYSAAQQLHRIPEPITCQRCIFDVIEEPIKRDIIGVGMCIANFATAGFILILIETQVFFYFILFYRSIISSPPFRIYIYIFTINKTIYIVLKDPQMVLNNRLMAV